jgi:ubiquitin-protein ligase
MDVQSILSPQSKKRLYKDIELASTSLSEQKLWYTYDEADMTKGWAMIQGPEKTPYEGCLFVFSFKFPGDYPFSPPAVQFLTSDGTTRFHPNLYVQGKVCLSILGTYSGPSWSASLSLSSVLLSILGLLDSNPLAHEPGYSSGTLEQTSHKEYADAVEHNSIKLMIQTIKSFEENPQQTHHIWYRFRETVQEILPEIKTILRRKILEKATGNERIWNIAYAMSIRSFWKHFAETVSWIAA